MKRSIFLLLFAAIFARCSDRLDWVPAPAPRVQGLSPAQGTEGTEVVITGAFFSAEPYKNSVTFNGVPATIVKADGSQLEVLAPDSSTGPVAVTVNGKTASQKPVFKYQ